MLVPLLGIVLGACQPLPRPFEASGVPALDPLRTGTVSGVYVRAITAEPAAAGETLSRLLAHELQDRGVPASLTSLNQGSLVLFGSARAAPLAATDEVEILVRWELVDPWGRLIFRHDEKSRTARTHWEDAATEALAPIAQRTAQALAAALGQPPAAGNDEPALPALVIGPIAGAPGDGAESLARALGERLRRAGFDLVSLAEPGSLIVEGEVRIGEAGTERLRLELVWIVRAAEGEELGSVRQGGEVTAEQVDGPWGALAETIAENSAIGLLDLIRQSLDAS